MSLNDVLGWLGRFVSLALPTLLLGIPVFKWLAQKWVEERLNIRLERFKAERQIELEAFKAEIERQGHLDEREFEILPKTWLMLHEAQGAAASLMTPFKMCPDFERLSESGRKEILDDLKIPEFRKQELLSSADSETIGQALDGTELHTASEKQRLFHNYLIEQRIFLTPEC